MVFYTITILGPKLPSLLKFIKQVSTGKTKDYLLKNFRFEEDIEKNGMVSDAISLESTNSGSGSQRTHFDQRTTN